MRIVVIGEGKVGFTLTRELSREGHDLLVIDNRKDALVQVEERLDVMVLEGNGASVKVQQAAEAAKKPKKGLVSRVAKMMEEDDGNEIAGINALPPRISKDEAYHPAKTPQKNGKRKR